MMDALVYDIGPARWTACKVAGWIAPAAYWSRLSGLQLKRVPVPPLPSPQWVRLRPILGGICGTDIAAVMQRHHPASILQVFSSLPAVLGHENVSVVEDVGAAVSRWRPGDRVVVEPTLSCVPRGIEPVCRQCAAGRFTLCENFRQGPLPVGSMIGWNCFTGGSWAPHFVAHESQLYRVPEDISDEEAVLTDPVAGALHAVLRHRPGDGQSVLILGAGLLGMGVAAAIRALEPIEETAGTEAGRYKHGGAGGGQRGEAGGGQRGEVGGGQRDKAGGDHCDEAGRRERDEADRHKADRHKHDETGGGQRGEAGGGGKRCRIVAVVRHERQRELMQRFGADETIRVGRKDPQAIRYGRVAERAGGKVFPSQFGHQAFVGGFDVVYECVGTGQSLTDAMKYARSGGAVVEVGASDLTLVDTAPLWFDELNLVGTNGRAFEQYDGRRMHTYEIVFELIRQGRLGLKGLVTHRFAISDYRQAFAGLANRGKSGAMKVAFEPPTQT
jgi:threonine dehydrogenase-like Zn-dependent dehydrogenase